jgi:hypothetical protein
MIELRSLKQGDGEVSLRLVPYAFHPNRAWQGIDLGDVMGNHPDSLPKLVMGQRG